nr:lysM domain-containing GPI-anchored protein 2 isoform X1 [Ziziphus jujuba var. spinosa]
MGYATVFVGLCLLCALASTEAQFNCSSQSKCSALIDYQAPNKTTLGAIKTLFGVKKFYNLLGANNLGISTPQNTTVAEKQTILIPFMCMCANGTGVSDNVPKYSVKAGDSLDHIARDIFSALTTYEEIARVNNIAAPAYIIQPGQHLWIPLPCSCDLVDGVKVVHYGHKVEKGSTLEIIARRYGTTENTLLRLNGMTNSSELLADQILDVPLQACSSSIKNESLDTSLLLSNGTYALTAYQCVKCKCDAANNFTLQCEPSQLNSTHWKVCPSTQCEDSSLVLGNTTGGSSTCELKTTCAYAGYNNSTIFTVLANSSTCPGTAPSPNNKAGSKMGLQILSWNFLFVTVHLVFLCLCLSQ